jgi:hypothetical protein
MASNVVIGDVVVVVDPDCSPAVRMLSPAEAWAGSGRMLFVRDPDELVAHLRALAPRFDDARARVWRDLRADLPARRFTWRWERGGGRTPVDCWLELDGAIARRPDRGSSEAPWQTMDDLYVHGPSQPGIPRAMRQELIDHLALDPRDAFPVIDHAAIPARSWSWDQRDDGETGASIGGAAVVAGYQYRHDIGWTEYAVERVVTGAADIFLSAPPEVEAELLALLRAAVVVT